MTAPFEQTAKRCTSASPFESVELPLFPGDRVRLDGGDHVLAAVCGAEGPVVAVQDLRGNVLGAALFSRPKGVFVVIAPDQLGADFTVEGDCARAAFRKDRWVRLHGSDFQLAVTYFSNKGPIIAAEDSSGRELRRVRFNLDSARWIMPQAD